MWNHRDQDEKPWVFTAEDGRERSFSRYSAARAFACVSGTIKNLTLCAAEYLGANPPEAAETVIAAVKGGDQRTEALRAAIAADKTET